MQAVCPSFGPTVVMPFAALGGPALTVSAKRYVANANIAL